MITIDDFREAAAKCHAANHPNETAFLLLAAATYMIDRESIKTDSAEKSDSNQELRQMIADLISRGYSYSAPPEPIRTVSYRGKTDFAKAVDGKNIDDVIGLFDELMTAISVYQKNLYDLAMSRLHEMK